MADDRTPAEIIRTSPLSGYQLLMIAICCLAYAADGVDFVTLPYAAPALSKAWGIKPALLGVAFSANGVGLVVGSFFVAPLADRIGRRAMTQGALAFLIVAMLLGALANSITMLIVQRLITGLAIGTLVVTLNVMVSEYANDRSRALAIGTLHTGYTLGTMLGAGIAAILLERFGWRSLFVAAGAINLITFLLSLLLSETPAFLATRQPPNALARLNRLFARMKLPPVAALPPVVATERGSKVGVGALLGAGARTQTLLLCFAGFVFTLAGTFIASWRPQILSDAGIDPYWIGVSGVIAGAAGILSHLAVGGLARATGETVLAVGTLLLMGLFFVMFGVMPHGHIGGFMAVTGLATLFNTGAYTALFLVGIATFPAATRNAGMGFFNGCSRIGTVLGPSLGGLIIAAGFSRGATFGIFGSMLVLPALAVILARRRGPIRLAADET